MKTSKSFAKKIIFIILLISIAGFYYLYSSMDLINIKKVSQINIYDDNSSSPLFSLNDMIGSDGENISKIVNSTVDKKNVSELIVGDETFDIEFIMNNNDTMTYLIHLDIENGIAKISDKSMENFYTVPEEFLNFLFTNQYFETAYKYSTAPNATTKINNDDSLYFNSNTKWSFKKLDGKWYKKDFSNSYDFLNFIKLSPSDTINIIYDLIPDESILKIYRDDELIYENNVDASSFNPPGYEGDFKYVILSKWENGEYYKGSCEISFYCSMNAPPEFYVGNSNTKRGDVFFIIGKYIDDNETISLSQNINKKNPEFTKINDYYISLFPVNYLSNTGNRNLAIWTEKDGVMSSEKFNFQVKISDRDFEIQHLIVDETIEKSTRNNESYAQYNKYFPPSRLNSVPEKLWEDEFIMPATARITTEYGEKRYVNNALTSYRHSGIDIAAKKGTEVLATNSGKVVLAMNLIVSGNTVVVDHGLNLFSAYKHLDYMNVSAGEYVDKGHILGVVGTTGFSTGPHLHFEISINNTTLDPQIIVGKDPLKNLENILGE